MSPKCLRISTVVTLFLTAVVGQPSLAATINATNCNSSAVQSAISNAQAGDIVAVPAGNCSWSSFSIPGGVHVRGAGTGVTNVTVNGTVTINKHSSRSVELSGFSFTKRGGGNSAKMFRVTGAWQDEPPLIHDNEFTVNDAAIFSYETNGGVVYNNAFLGTLNDSALQHNMRDDTTSWATPDTMGARDTSGKINLYIEDNTFEGMANQATDFGDGSRIVFRHNEMRHSSFNSHGLATSPVGIRHFEIYGNSFEYPNSSVNQNWHIWLRGGTGVIYENNVDDIDGSQWGNKQELLMSVRAAVDGAGAGCCTSWPCKHQVGQNHDGNSQYLDALTIWNNTGTLSHGLNDGWANNCGQNMANYLQNGRDFVFAASAKSGYAPYAYPHPLRSNVIRPMAPEDLVIAKP
jgi:hypothetical protein